MKKRKTQHDKNDGWKIEERRRKTDGKILKENRRMKRMWKNHQLNQTSANQGSNLRFIDLLYPKLNSNKSENDILANQ